MANVGEIAAYTRTQISVTFWKPDWNISLNCNNWTINDASPTRAGYLAVSGGAVAAMEYNISCDSSLHVPCIKR
jgi:hypothetical protein